MRNILNEHPACQLENHILLVRQCHWRWNGISSFWAWIQTAIYEMVPFNFPKEEEIQGCTVSWQNYGYILQEEKGFVLVNLLPRGIIVNSKHWNIKKPECSRLLCLSTRKMSEVLLVRDYTRLHSSVHTTEAMKNYSVAASTLHFWPYTSTYLFLRGGGGRPVLNVNIHLLNTYQF
jgi:hypothetical protein